MRVEHVAIWVSDLEIMRLFFEKYFGATAPSKKYENSMKGFESYFLVFSNGARLEIMKSRKVTTKQNMTMECLGFAHLAVSVGSKEKVDEVTFRLKSDGFSVIDGPRVTGDGYYESAFLDPEGNTIEITI